ncbi:MAG TPA: hypothetical protein VIS96_00910 [Terrimicrobiaceae bacterium]
MSDSSYFELRLLLEELCCDLSRFEHLSNEGLAPEHVQIDREVASGQPGAFADIRVRPRGRESYFIEVKYGCPDEAILRSLTRKYAQPGEVVRHASRVVLVVDRRGRADWEGLVCAARAALLGADLKLEVWDEERLAAALRAHFDVELGEIVAERLVDVRQAIDHAHEWQRQIDREQSSVGLHAGVALGDLHLLSLRPFSRTHLGFIGDCINVAARLMSHATVDEIIVSNSFYQRLPESARCDFCHNEPVEARNVGRIKAWKATMR